ncbi:hypothetical protein LP7551_01259 [Roseibium album]|nr:hypothetical protein LP7551_01259 [Roseibium album]
MKKKGKNEPAFVRTSAGLAEKFTRGADLLLEQARSRFGLAMESYANGDRVAALSLLLETKDLADLRTDIPPDIPLQDDAPFAIRLSAADHILASCESVLPLLQPDLFLQLADKNLKKSFVFKKGGSFKGSKKTQDDTYCTERCVNWFFWTDKKFKCKNICLISVFCFFEKDGKGNYTKLLQPAVNGFLDSYKKVNTDMGGDPKKRKSGLPHGGKDVGGYAVDTPFFHPGKSGVPPVKCPCYFGQSHIDDKGNDKEKGKHIRGEDRPAAHKTEYLEYFETAAICLDKKPFVVLNSIKWRVLDGKLQILNKKGKPLKNDGRGKSITKGEVIDQGDASPAFKRALLDWIERAKKLHGITDIECGKK